MEGTAGPRQAAEQKSNAELLNSTNASQKLPEWFRQSESMLQLPPSQLKEAIVQYMCLDQLEKGEPIGARIRKSMILINQDNQIFHAGGPVQDQSPSRQPGKAKGGGANSAKRSMGGGAQKPRKGAGDAAPVVWAPLAQSKRIYPDEKSEPFVKLAPPKSKPANCEPTQDARVVSRDELISERQRQLKEQVAALEEKDHREGLLPREKSVLQAFKAESIKLQLVPMQRRARAHALDNAWPPAVRLQDSSKDPSASYAGMEPAPLFAAHPLDKLLNTDLSRHPDTQLSRIAPTSVKSQTPVNLRYYDSKKRSFLQELFRHRERFFQYHQKRREREKDLARACKRRLEEIEERERRKKEKAEKDRLKALKEHNTEEYYKLVKEHKNEKILNVLTETDKYLKALGLAVKVQKQNTAKKLKDAADEMEEDDKEKGVGFQRTLEKNSGEVDVKALMQNSSAYYHVAHTEKEAVEAQPDMLVGGTLRKYQMQGLQWLVSLYNNRLSGVLADEMGLGKTIQIVALIAYLMEVKNVNGPFLIVAPLSVIDNWVREFESWTPHLKKIIYYGDKDGRKKLQKEAVKGQFNVMLTSYELVLKDANFMAKINWVYIIVDEGHRMKNAQSKLTTTLSMKFPSKFRILITGTPLQNNLNELWSLLNFLLPDIFRHDSNFEEWFNSGTILGATGDTTEMDEEEKLLVIDRLHQVLRPFLLRRLKSDVEAELKPKIEKVIKCNMSACQWRLYNDIRNRGAIELQPKSDADPSGKKRTTTNIMMELRKACNHPYLFWFDTRPASFCSEIIRCSGKFELLHRILPKFKATGHKVLIFFQMTKVMDIFGDFLQWQGHRYLRLDGNTKSDERAQLIEIFNTPESPFGIFILSTKAGGLGLNLPAADTVIIFDSDWNPQNDLQAQDRAHRIGQTREVRVLRLTCANTIEEDIIERTTYKKELGGAAIDGGMFNEKSTVEDRHEFLRKILLRTGGKNKAQVLSHEEMNRELARDEEEFKVFQDMDRAEMDARPADLEPLMTEREIPSWLKYYEEEQLSAGQKKQQQKVEKASRKSRKRKTASYKEEEISHSSDLDSSTDEETAAYKGRGKAGRAGPKRQGGGVNADSDDDEAEGVDEQKAAGSAKGRGQGKDKSKPEAGVALIAPTEDKNNNHCEVCEDGGDLVCCDFCVCAYHEHCLRAKAEDLPDPYKCPKCTGDFNRLVNQYLCNPQTSIYPRDFCDLCGRESLDKDKGGAGLLVNCRTCDRAFHTFCAGETDELFEDNHHWSWKCPECTGTAAETFSWSRLILPVQPEPQAEGIFVEHHGTSAPASAFDPGLGNGLGGPEGAPAGRGNRGHGRGGKPGREGKAAASSRGASKGPVPEESAHEAAVAPQKKRGRPRKYPLSEPASSPAASEKTAKAFSRGQERPVQSESDGDDEGDGKQMQEVESSGRSPDKSTKSPEKGGGKGDEQATPSRQKRRRRIVDDDEP